MHVVAAGLLTGWGEGLGALPESAREKALGRTIIPIPRPTVAGDRFRRATRECLLGVTAIEALLREATLERATIRGSGTALVYVTATAYAAANRAFIEAVPGAGTLHFPYTAPSAVSAEVAIEFGLTGPYTIFIGGPEATVDALWHASALLRHGRCERAVVLAVETFLECADLYARGRWLLSRPLVEAAAAVLLVPGPEAPPSGAAGGASDLDRMVRVRAGETLACAPLIALALALEVSGREIAGDLWNRKKSSTS
jgi:hypothetical protein